LYKGFRKTLLDVDPIAGTLPTHSDRPDNDELLIDIDGLKIEDG